jgi:hypothetical protein
VQTIADLAKVKKNNKQGPISIKGDCLRSIESLLVLCNPHFPRNFCRRGSAFLDINAPLCAPQVSRDDIAALDEVDPSERRKLWQFVQAQQVSLAQISTALWPQSQRLSGRPLSTRHT